MRQKQYLFRKREEKSIFLGTLYNASLQVKVEKGF